jgi:hypothetical protein
MYIRDKISLEIALTGSTDGASNSISEIEFNKLVKDMREFLLIARQIEKRI